MTKVPHTGSSHSTGQIHILTGLRGIAALIVFISHAANRGYLPNFLGTGFGQIGVMLFFLLSGFLMAHLYLSRDCTPKHVMEYGLARIGRVFPLYMVLIILSFVISNYIFEGFYYSIEKLEYVKEALLFMGAPYAFWTIPVEVQFYLIFIVFWWCHHAWNGKWNILIFGLLTCLPPIIAVLYDHEIIGQTSRYLFSFFIGIVTALLYRHKPESGRFKQLADFAGLPFFILLFLNLPQIRKYVGLSLDQNVYIRTWLDPLTWAIIWGVFWCALMNSASLTFLNWRPFAFFGGISYGFYLLHPPILQHTLVLPLPNLVKLGLAFLITLFLAVLSFYWFEKPVGSSIRNFRLTPRVPDLKVADKLSKIGKV
ncbi:MAG: acyltransferase [Nitrospirales bacterium]|nr:acyltransferase [Nitrospirales bacterium]